MSTGPKVVTRFAPSPTGYLHIGGARTALFNWAYARRHGGIFILRMEDTDAARSTAQSTRGIIQDLQWLGIDWDYGPNPDAADVYDIKSQKGPNPPYFQSQRVALYAEYLDRLYKAGRAYRCFMTQEQLAAGKKTAAEAKKPYKYDPTEALNRSEADQKALIDQGKPFVWRFKMPGSDITVADLILGDVTIKSAELEDFVIMKSEAAGGLPTFHFANVVDDATMGVTHVLRAQEHLMNTPKHVAMFDALGIPRPSYAHMPLIFNPDSTKMSKRDKSKAARNAAQTWIKANAGDAVKLRDFIHSKGIAAPNLDQLTPFLDKKSDDNAIAQPIGDALGVNLPEIDVHDFKKSGYLQSVILNYISLLGWSAGNDIERFDLKFFVENFGLERIGKTNARFDRAKLLAFNSEAITKLTPDEFFDRWKAHLNTFHPAYTQKFDDAKLKVLAEAYRPRSRTLEEAALNGKFFILEDDKIQYDMKAAKKVLLANDNAGVRTLVQLQEVLETVAPFEPKPIHDALEKFATETGKSLGDVAQPIRVAVSGSTVSPPINDTLALLGKASTLARISRCISMAGSWSSSSESSPQT
jgi:glutamyl/glutaminyl-tRNA synthetase